MGQIYSTNTAPTQYSRNTSLLWSLFARPAVLWLFEYLKSVTQPVHSSPKLLLLLYTCSSVANIQCHLHYCTCSKNVHSSFLSPAASTRLTLREIENELSEVTATDWYPLGVQLGLRPPTLSEILNNYPLDTQRFRQEVLHIWICSAQDVSWKSLAQAVQALGRYESLAQKLKRKVPPAPKG